MTLKCKRFLAYAVLFILALLINVKARTQKSSFDSAFQATLAIKSDTARLKQLLHINDGNLSPRQHIKLNNAILEEAQALKVDSAITQAYIQIGRAYSTLNDYAEALKMYIKALSVAEKTNDYKRQALTFGNIGWMYKNTGETSESAEDLDKAKEYIDKGLEITRKHQLQSEEISLMSNLAVIYDLKKLHNKAIETYTAIIPKIDPKNKWSLINIRMNLGISYKNSRQLDSALAQYKIALGLADSIKDDFYKMVVIDNMANLYYEMGQYGLSTNMAFEAINNSYTQDFAAIRVDMYDCLRKVYEKQGNYKNALAYSQKLLAIKDSVLNKEKSAQLKDMQEKYETDIKDKQINVQQGQISYNQKLNLILGAGAVAFLLIAVFIYANLRKTARLNRTISAQRDELAKQSNTLSVMMKELHHRVKNNLQIVSSLLNLQSMRLSDTEAVNAVKESRERVQAMSLIHQRLYKTDDITGINMQEYVKDLADFLAASYGYGPDDIVINIDIAEEWVDVDKALPIGLILNELLTNAFKYAFNGVKQPQLDISFKHTGSDVTLTVKDNGHGLDPAKWNKSKTGSFGRQLVKALCSQLRAKEKLEVENGTSFTFIIPQAA